MAAAALNCYSVIFFARDIKRRFVFLGQIMSMSKSYICLVQCFKYYIFHAAFVAYIRPKIVTSYPGAHYLNCIAPTARP